MAFINNMRDKLSQAGQSTVQKAKNLSEVAKLNTTISTAEKEINDLYGKLGYEVYRAYVDKPLPEVTELFSQISGLHQVIKDSKEQIKVINAANICPQCGAKINKGMAFCSGCGYKLEFPEEPAPAKNAFCSSCGAPLTGDAAFCTSCGQKIG